MKKIILSLALLYSTFGLALPAPINVWLQCENGIHATYEDGLLSIEGIYRLPLIKTENENRDQITLVFADKQTYAKMLIIYKIPAFYLSDKGRWIPCMARKYPQESTK
ncbi:hypothetical protein AB7W78_16045 [Providencia rettgeri]